MDTCGFHSNGVIQPEYPGLLPVGFAFGCSGNLMNTEVGTIEFRFGIQPQSHNLLKHAIHHQATDQGHSHSTFLLALRSHEAPLDVERMYRQVWRLFTVDGVAVVGASVPG